MSWELSSKNLNFFVLLHFLKLLIYYSLFLVILKIKLSNKLCVNKGCTLSSGWDCSAAIGNSLWIINSILSYNLFVATIIKSVVTSDSKVAWWCIELVSL